MTHFGKVKVVHQKLEIPAMTLLINISLPAKDSVFAVYEFILSWHFAGEVHS